LKTRIFDFVEVFVLNSALPCNIVYVGCAYVSRQRMGPSLCLPHGWSKGVDVYILCYWLLLACIL